MKVLSNFHQRQNVTREKPPKRLSYEKGICRNIDKIDYWRQYYKIILKIASP